MEQFLKIANHYLKRRLNESSFQAVCFMPTKNFRAQKKHNTEAFPPKQPTWRIASFYDFHENYGLVRT